MQEMHELSAVELAKVEQVLGEVIAAMRAEGRDPQQQQVRLGMLFGEAVDRAAATGAYWAVHLRALEALGRSPKLDAALRQYGIEPE